MAFTREGNADKGRAHNGSTASNNVWMPTVTLADVVKQDVYILKVPHR